jgi:hypothetical protein
MFLRVRTIGVNMNYLVEAIHKQYETTDENRLSQVFSASFNNSEVFKKLFLKFIGCPFKKDLSSKTQESFKAGNKNVYIDVCIFDAKGKPVIVIENKIDFPLGQRQLRTYNGLKPLAHAQKMMLVKHHFEPLPQALGWKVFHWMDLYGWYSTEVAKIVTRDIDRFIIENFLNYLEELQMTKVHLIKGEDLRDMAKAIHAIRNSDEPFLPIGKRVFQAADDYMNMLEQIINKVRQEKTITERLGRNVRFSPWIGCWSKKYDTASRGNVWMGIELRLNKAFKKIFYIDTGIAFNDKVSDEYKICIEAYDKDYNLMRKKTHKNSDLNFDKYAAQVIQTWTNWLR